MTQPDTYPARCLACGADMRQHPCPDCDGTGSDDGGLGRRCERCNGFGHVWRCPRDPYHPERRDWRAPDAGDA